jgi:hypothetical protein
MLEVGSPNLSKTDANFKNKIEKEFDHNNSISVKLRNIRQYLS